MGDKLDIWSTPCTPPEADEIVIKNRAWVINPVNWISQQTSLFDGLKYPLILGGDIAGEVVEVVSTEHDELCSRNAKTKPHCNLHVI